jgi:hypothetical protein
MSERLSGDYVPLPKKLPKTKDDKSSNHSSSDEERRRRKGKERARVINYGPAHVDDPDYYPVVETPSTSGGGGIGTPLGRRDSGVYSGTGSPHSRDRKYYDKQGRPITVGHDRRPLITDSADTTAAIQDLTREFNTIITNERLDKLEAEAKANRLAAQLNKAQAEIEQSKRSSWLDDREKRVGDREKVHRDEKRLSQTSSRESPPGGLRPRDVVVKQPSPPIRETPADVAKDALDKARADYQRKQQRDSGNYSGRGGGKW